MYACGGMVNVMVRLLRLPLLLEVLFNVCYIVDHCLTSPFPCPQTCVHSVDAIPIAIHFLHLRNISLDAHTHADTHDFVHNIFYNRRKPQTVWIHSKLNVLMDFVMDPQHWSSHAFRFFFKFCWLLQPLLQLSFISQNIFYTERLKNCLYSRKGYNNAVATAAAGITAAQMGKLCVDTRQAPETVRQCSASLSLNSEMYTTCSRMWNNFKCTSTEGSCLRHRRRHTFRIPLCDVAYQ